jgi:hypothetical protein
MEWVNHFAPAIQALAAVGIAILTFVLVYATVRYVEVSEALQKPCVTLLAEPRGDERAIMDAPCVTQVSQKPNVEMLNVGTGPALYLRYGLRQVNSTAGGLVMHPTGFVNYLKAGQQWQSQLARSLLSNRNFDFQATYTSLSGRKYKTEVHIEDGVIKSFNFGRTREGKSF